MDDLTPKLVITLDGVRHREVELTGDSFTVGRGSSSFTPDLALDDEGSWISRRHCVFTQAWGSWWIEDCGSRNGTFIRNGDSLRRLGEKTQLSSDDVVCITADADDSGPTSTWEMRLMDPSATRTLDASPTRAHAPPVERACVRWEPDVMRLEVLGAGEPRVVELRKQGYDLIAYMAARNAANDGSPVVCTVDELLEAVWGDPDGWDKYRPPTADNLRDLVLSVRRAIEPDSAAPTILENQRGVGYRLHTAPA
ncbi:MAG: FHA domain-containing protein [Acidimicrobiales bacterium]